jgi:sterol desaturase/sphingolipid hydroxylase (fatty acid hydroxylase superfamily)
MKSRPLRKGARRYTKEYSDLSIGPGNNVTSKNAPMEKFLTSNFAVSLGLDAVRLGIWLVALTVIFVPLERCFALRRQKIFRKAFETDVAYYFLNNLVPNILMIVPLSAVAWLAHHWVPGALYTWMASWSFWVRFTATMVVAEVGAYWAHRWNHQVPLLWRFHAVHHSAEEVDWLVHTRAHPVDMVFTKLCAYAPLYLLGLAQPMGNRMDLLPYLVTIAATFWGFFIHANFKWRLGWLEWIISTPAFHHWHHTNDGPEVINKNYAPLMPWIDAIFGTLYLPKRLWPRKYGTDSPVAPRLVDQLVDPLTGVFGHAAGPHVSQPAELSAVHD